VSRHFEPEDYSVVVKNRGTYPKPWRWEIYRAARDNPVDQSPVYFESATKASRAGREALKLFLAKLYA
jgi:hypothetical protein